MDRDLSALTSRSSGPHRTTHVIRQQSASMASQSCRPGRKDNELITVDGQLWTIADYDYDDIHITERSSP
jgi:hypothetical protein